MEDKQAEERRYKIISLPDLDFTMLFTMLSTTSAHQHDHLAKLGIQSIVLAENSSTIFIKQSEKDLLKVSSLDKVVN